MAPPVWQTGASTAGVTAASIAVTLPSSIAANDIVIVTLYKENTAAVTPPAGFTEKGAAPTTTAPQAQHTFWKRMAGGESGTVTFSWTGSVYTAATADRFSGCVTSGDPIEGIGTNSSNASVTTLNVSLAATSVDTILFWASTDFSGGSSYTPPGTYTEREDLVNVLANATKSNAAGGATGNVTGTANVSGPMTSVLLDLLPIASGAAALTQRYAPAYHPGTLPGFPGEQFAPWPPWGPAAVTAVQLDSLDAATTVTATAAAALDVVKAGVTPLPAYAPGWFPRSPSSPGGEPFAPWPAWQGATPKSDPLAAALTVTATGAAALTEAKPLNAATTITAATASALTEAKPLNAAIAVTAAAAAALDVVKAGVTPVPAYPPAWFPAAPGVPGGKPFAPWPAWTGFGGVSTPVDLLNAALTATTAIVAALTEAKPLNAAATVTAARSAALTEAKPLNAALTVTATRAAAETTAKPLNAATTVTATLAAALTTVPAAPSAVTAPQLYVPSWFPGAPTVPAAEPFAPWPVWTGAQVAPPPAFQRATSSPTVADPRDGTATVSGAVHGASVAAQTTSAPSVADPRDGSASVTRTVTSTPTVTDR